MWIYYIEKYGQQKAEQLFRADYIRDKGHVKNLSNPMFSVLMGKLQYLKMVKGGNDNTYLRLKDRFDNVIGHENGIDALLDVWENEGIDEAIKKFESNGKR